jgi:hypothetical protein
MASPRPNQVPSGAVLRLVGAGNASQLRLIVNFRGHTLDHEIEAVIESVASGRQYAVLVLFRVLGLALARVSLSPQPCSRSSGGRAFDSAG